MLDFALRLAVFTLVIGVVLVQWSRWIGGRYGAPRWTRWVGPIGVALWTLGPITSAIGVVGANAETGRATAADRQRILVNAFAEAAWSLVVGFAVIIVTVVVLLALTWKYEWGAKTPAPTGDGPYR